MQEANRMKLSELGVWVRLWAHLLRIRRIVLKE